MLIPISNRSVLTIRGNDRHNFLQNLITNDIGKLANQAALYALCLTPQGRFFHDFIITETKDTIRLEVEKERLADLNKVLKLYTLRSAISIEDTSSDWQIMAYIDKNNELPSAFRPYAYLDPRSNKLGYRMIVPSRLNLQTT